jgi:hypothetical protein
MGLQNAYLFSGVCCGLSLLCSHVLISAYDSFQYAPAKFQLRDEALPIMEGIIIKALANYTRGQISYQILIVTFSTPS